MNIIQVKQAPKEQSKLSARLHAPRQILIITLDLIHEAIADGPRSFEPLVSDEDVSSLASRNLACNSSILYTMGLQCHQDSNSGRTAHVTKTTRLPRFR
ncbi:hypothetical protein TNCV_308111 [Trichonephila clavipes]|nr:hypothetical protein TNCV_308111 [Trichonephila clavipes]